MKQCGFQFCVMLKSSNEAKIHQPKNYVWTMSVIGKPEFKTGQRRMLNSKIEDYFKW